jgi:hypothetical protein
MKNSNPTIYIRPVTEKPGFYIAYFSSEVLQATVSLHFKEYGKLSISREKLSR